MVRGEIAPKKVYEDDRILAFHDVNPQAPVHFLVIPKAHIPTANDVTPESAGVMGYLLSVIPKLAADLGIAEGGYRLVVNCNRDAQQTVFHIHVHVLGGRPFRWPPG
ncbi:histidine triad nucleotide-binding protein [bacterium]|nr:histidine triad nucleotide-binding protein [bacterium]